jgi:integrase
MTLNQYLDRWLELAARPKLRAKSFTDYESLLGRYIRPVLGERSLFGLATLDVQKMYHRMQERELSPRTIQYTHSVLHAALEQAVHWRLLDSNPASGIELPKPLRAEMRAMQADEARRFLLHATGKRYGALFALALMAVQRLPASEAHYTLLPASLGVNHP